MKSTIKRLALPVGVLSIALGIGIYSSKGQSTDEIVPLLKKEYVTLTLEKGNVTSEVFVKGKLQPKDEAHLAFEVMGKVQKINVKVGDHVKKGQALVKLDGGTLWTQVQEQQAYLEAENSKLKESKKGTRPEQINVQKAVIQKSQTSIQDAESLIMTRIGESVIEAKSAIYDKSDTLFSNPKTSNPNLIVRASNFRLENTIKNERLLIGRMLYSWENQINASNQKQDLQSNLTTTKGNLQMIKDFLDKESQLVNAVNPSSQISSVQINQWKKDITDSLRKINSLLISLSNSEEKLNMARSGLVTDNSQLDLLYSGSTQEQIQISNAGVKSVKARINNLNVQIGKRTLYAPFDGIITQQDATLGEIVMSNKPIITLMTDEYELEADLPEIDIAKTNEGQKVKINFDAFSETDVMGTIRIIEPSKKEIQGSTYYMGRIDVEKTNGVKFLPGLSADAYIVVQSKEDVLTISQKALQYKENRTFVQIIKGKNLVSTNVTVGIRDRNGLAEIIDGVTKDDKIIIPE